MKPVRKFLIMLVMTVIIIGVIGAVLLTQSPVTPETTSSTRNSTTTTSVTLPKLPLPPFASSNPLYIQAGYPKISNNTVYPNIGQVNYTVHVRSENASYQIGVLQAPVKGLGEAVQLAASAAGLDPVNYSLASADFSPGAIYNEALDFHPKWYLSFARIYRGFWIWGYLNDYTSVSAVVDAFSGNVTDIQRDESHLPSEAEQPELKVSAEHAVETVRHYKNQNIPEILLTNGSVTRLEPRIILLGPDSRNYLLENPFNSSLSGTKRLYWIVELYSLQPQFGSRGTFLVDAETGELAAADSDLLFPHMRVPQVYIDVNYSTVEGLTVSDQKFPINGKPLGVGDWPSVVSTNILTIKPGSNGVASLKLTPEYIDGSIEVTLSMRNPLHSVQNLTEVNVPQGVSIKFKDQRILLPRNGSAETTIQISAEPDAPKGTYLLEIHATYNLLGWGQPAHSSTRLLLTVWNGTGGWPSPVALMKPPQNYSEGIKPPQIVLVYNGEQYFGAQFSYCWSKHETGNRSRAVCADYVSADERKDIPSLITIRQNSTVGFEVVGYKNPDQFRASFYQPGPNRDLIDAPNNGSLQVSIPKGIYYLTVSVGWNQVGSFSDVFQVKIE